MNEFENDYYGEDGDELYWADELDIDPPFDYEDDGDDCGQYDGTDYDFGYDG